MKVGVVGCGNVAAYHLPHILRHKRVEAVSIVDVDHQKAEEIARQFKISNVYGRFEVMLREQNPDVVHILTPPPTHAELAIRAMESGCHVLVEKPMAMITEEADEMIAAASRNGVKLCVDHNYLFDPLMTKARELVQKRKVGRVVHVETYYSFDIKRLRGLSGSPNSGRHWSFSLPGGLLLDSLPHPLSVLLDFVKDPVTVWAVKKSNSILPENLPDELRVLIDTKEATGSLSVSLGTRPDCFTVNIYGTEMSVHVNLSNMTLVTRKNRHMPKKVFRFVDSFEQALQLLYCSSSSGLKVLVGRARPPGDVGPVITKFYESVENGSEPPVTGEEGKAVVKFISEIWKQAA
jgi:predicted dehydrogenase